MKTERRSIFCDLAKAELRTEEGHPPQAVGYAAVFYRAGDKTTEYELWPGYRERILAGAFDKVLENDVRALFNHDVNQVLGRTASETLRLSVDDKGLRYEIDLPETTTGKDLKVSLDRRDVSGSSFSFFLDHENGGASTVYEENGEYIREIRAVSELLDVGPVTYPAYTGTSASARDMESASAELEQMKQANSCRDRLALDIRLKQIKANS